MAVIYGPDGATYHFPDKPIEWSLADALKVADSIFGQGSKKDDSISGEEPVWEWTYAVFYKPEPPVQLKAQSPVQLQALSNALSRTSEWDDRALWCLY